MKTSNKRNGTRILSTILALCLVISLVMIVPNASAADKLGKFTLVSQTEYAVSPGVTEKDILLNTTNGNEQNKGFLMEVDPANSNVSLVSCYKNYSGTAWGMQTPTLQAKAAEAVLKQSDPNANVVGVINTSFFNMSTGEPNGALVMNGVKYHDTTPGWGYFAVYKDGHVDIDNGATPLGDDVLEATSGRELLVWDGNLMVSPDNDPDRLPRAAIGITGEGKVIVYVNDGRQAPVSVGMSVRELAEVMQGLGCVRALNLDGGGSATLMTEREGTGNLSIKNSPSDGFERAVSSTLLIVSTAKPSGEFDHASLSPNGEYYTPASTVAFSALGVDSAGVSVALPEGLTWALEDDSMGTIDPSSGVFTASEKTGPVVVQMKQGDKVVGRTTVHVQAPDKISFLNDSVNLKYGQQSDLGLTATYQGNTLNIKDGDIVWTLENEEGNGSIGAFSGNTFTASENNAERNLSASADVRATSRWDDAVTNTVLVSVGKEPVVVLDGGEVDADGNYILGKDYKNIAYVHADANGGGLAYETHADDHGNVVVVHYINGNGTSRGGIASAEQVDIDTGKVRFGEKALRLDYDFRNINGIEGACVGFDSDWEIPGSPTGIGFWCYAPENTPNLWVRIRVRDGSGAIKTMNFTTQSQNVGSAGDDTLLKEWNIGTKGGINWVGWKYIECDLSSVPGPITLLGGETIRIMDTNGGQGDMGRWICQKDDTGNVVYGPTFLGNPNDPSDVHTGHQKGYIYIDNLQLVYGTNNADIDNPVIKLLQAGPTLDTAVDLAADGSTVINSNEVTFYSEFKDVENENTSGLDFGYLYLDGKNMSENANFVSNMNDGKLVLNAMKLANGTHTVKVLVHDQYGNEAVVSRTFTVQGNDDTLTSVNLEPLNDVAPLGGTYSIALTSNRLEDVKAVTVEMTVENATVDGIDFADDYSGSTYTVENGVLKINAVRSEDASGSGEGTIGTIRMSVPSDLESGSYLIYSVTEGTVTYVSEKDSNVVNTFALPATRNAVTPAYAVELGICYEGAGGSEVIVKDLDGNPAKYVPVYLVNADGTSQKLGVTNKNGSLTTDALVELAEFQVFAHGSKGYSFIVKGTRLPAAGTDDGKPYYILENATQNAFSTKSISWMADPAVAEEKAVIEYALKSEYDKTGKLSNSVEGTSLLHGFDDAAALLNNVMITGLDINTEYAYRIGDGEIWSDVRTFKTIDNDVDSTTKLFVLGDTQTAVGETDNINAINHFLNDEEGLHDFTLGIQLGDAVEEPTQYHSWQGFLNAMEIGDGAFAHTDMLHVIGNHEQFGDPNAIAANAVFAMEPSTTHYSVTYGNVYVATIDFSMEEADVREAAQWLLEDASASDAPWKILVMHQPPYYTNPEGGSNYVHELLPPVIEEAGIEFVFSGHDHSYARTLPLIGGQPSENEDYGTYYYICGSTGEKSYPVVNNPDFHFAQAQKDYNAIFLGIEATDNEINVNTYDLTPGAAQPYSIIDTVHRAKHQPCADGEHSWVYRPGRDLLLCENCLARLDKAEYSGYAKMENTEDAQVYMIGGVLQTGWFTVDNEMLHAGDDYILHDTETRDTRTCTENGHIETVCKTCGATYKGSETFANGHKWDENHVCTVCGKQGIDIATLEGTISSPYYVMNAEGMTVRPTPTVKDGDYTLNIRNSTLGRDGYISWENYDKIGTATVIVEGRGDYYGELRIDYDIVPGKVADVRVSGNTEDGAVVSWTAVPLAETYKVYRYDFDTKELVEIAATEDDSTSVVVTGLEPNKAYKICVKACVTEGEKDYESASYSWADLKTNRHVHQLTAVAEVPATCTEPGVEAYWKCDACGKLFSDAAGKTPIEAPTAIPAAGHDWDDGVVTREATETEPGEMTFTCKLCGETKTEEIPVLDPGTPTQPTGTDEPTTPDQPDKPDQPDEPKKPCDGSDDCPSKAFEDVDRSAESWYHEAVDWAFTSKVTDGMDDTHFAPDASCTRAQAVTFLWRANGSPDPEKTDNPFEDVPADEWFTKAVLWAVENGITDGVDDTHFAPDAECTRAHIVTFLFRSAKGEAGEKNPFEDVPADEWFTEAVLWAVENGITDGVDDTHFAPDDTCTRAQIVTFLYRNQADQQ